MRRIKLSTSLIGRSRFALSIPFSSAFLFAQLSLSVHNPLHPSSHTYMLSFCLDGHCHAGQIMLHFFYMVECHRTHHSPLLFCCVLLDQSTGVNGVKSFYSPEGGGRCPFPSSHLAMYI